MYLESSNTSTCGNASSRCVMITFRISSCMDGPTSAMIFVVVLLDGIHSSHGARDSMLLSSPLLQVCHAHWSFLHLTEVHTWRPKYSPLSLDCYLRDMGGYMRVGSGKRDYNGVIEWEQESMHPGERSGKWSRVLFVWQQFY